MFRYLKEKRNRDPFVGVWLDQNGKHLIIRKKSGKYHVDYLTGEIPQAVIRSLLSKDELSLYMPAFLEGDQLTVELGSVGIGPTMILKFNKASNELIPSLVIGLYDDYEEDMGVPWVFPLSKFKKQE